MPVSDANLATHPPLSLAEVFREYAPFVWRTLRRLGVRDADVDDVCQEVFVVVFRRLDSFEERSSLRTWLYGISVRVASDYRRRAMHREVATEEPAGVPLDPHARIQSREALARLDGILENLDDDKRAVFVLYEIEQLTMAEVAEALQCPLQTAYSRLHAARKYVVEHMAEEGERHERA